MRKPAFCICENKDPDQLHGNREADQRLCFRYMDSAIPLLSQGRTLRCCCRGALEAGLEPSCFRREGEGGEYERGVEPPSH